MNPLSMYIALSALCLAPFPLPDGLKDSSLPTALLARVPLAFVENPGHDGSACLVARGVGGAVFVEPDAITLQFVSREGDDSLRGVNVRLVFEGASPGATVKGSGPLPGKANYFLGSDPSQWRTDIPTYAEAVVRDLYEGVDLRIHGGSEGRLEYDLLLAPHAALEEVSVRVEGAERTSLVEDGRAVLVETALGTIRQEIPAAWEVLAHGARRSIDSRFRSLGANRFGFEAPGREPGLALVIDPGLVFSTFLGGAGGDWATAVSVGAAAEITVSGSTLSADFPTTPGAFLFPSGAGDAFVTRLTAGGNAIVWSSILGGAGADYATALAVDGAGNATLCGITFPPIPSTLPAFPVTAGGYDITPNGGSDAFVARLSSTGSALLYSTFLGASGDEGAYGLAVNAAGLVTVGGATNSPSFPTVNAYDPTFNGGSAVWLYGGADGFVARIDPSIPGPAGLVYSTFLGGSGPPALAGDGVNSLAVDAAGRITVAGYTCSSNFPTTPGAFDATYNGNTFACPGDGFVARLDPSLGGAAQLVYSTFLAGPYIRIAGIALDATGAVVVTGEIKPPTVFPTTPGAFLTVPAGNYDVFVARLSLSGNGPADLLYSTLLGGSGPDHVVAQGIPYGNLAVRPVALDSAGVVTVVGKTLSTDFPTTLGAFDTVGNVTPFVSDVFVARLTLEGNGAADLLYSTYLGASAPEAAHGVALDGASGAVVVGATSSSAFPVTPGAYDTTFNGPFPMGSDGYIARFDMSPFGSPTPGCAGPPSIGMSGAPQIANTTFAITCANAPANGAGLLGFSESPLVPPLPVAGAFVWIDLSSPAFFTFFATSNAAGAAQLPVPIPNAPALVGLQAFVQFAWLDACAPGGVSASNALAITVQ